jgi:PhnB protein
MSNSFSAMLHIPGDVRDAIAFYQRAFGATVGWSTPPGSEMVAQLQVKGVEFWVHPAGEEIGNPSPAQLGGTPMQNHDYGWRDGSLMDPFGHRWEIGKPL